MTYGIFAISFTLLRSRLLIGVFVGGVEWFLDRQTVTGKKHVPMQHFHTTMAILRLHFMHRDMDAFFCEITLWTASCPVGLQLSWSTWWDNILNEDTIS